MKEIALKEDYPFLKSLNEKYVLMIPAKGGRHPLAEGAFGQICKVKSKQDKKFYAAKICCFEDIRKKAFMLPELFEKTKKSMQEELKILQTCNHPNIIKVFDVEPDNPEGTAFVMELMERDLKTYSWSYIDKNKKVPEEEIQKILDDCIFGLYYLNETKKLAHRDLKLENVLLDKSFNSKVTDFNTAKHVMKNLDSLKSQVGTLGFLAPELEIAYEKSETMEINEHIDWSKADIFSLGMIGLFLMNLDEAKLINKGFNDLNKNEPKKLQILDSFQKNGIYSKSLIDLERSMLNHKVAHRINMPDLMCQVGNRKLREIQDEFNKITLLDEQIDQNRIAHKNEELAFQTRKISRQNLLAEKNKLLQALQREIDCISKLDHDEEQKLNLLKAQWIQSEKNINLQKQPILSKIQLLKQSLINVGNFSFQLIYSASLELRQTHWP